MLNLLSNNGCDLILLEMMYRPERMEVVFDVMRKSKLPVWVGFSCRKSETGEILSLTDESNVTFKEMMSLAKIKNLLTPIIKAVMKTLRSFLFIR